MVSTIVRWVCVEYAANNRRLGKPYIVEAPIGAQVWSLPRHPKAVKTKCRRLDK